MRTGMGAMPGSSSWQIFPYGFGPMSEYVSTVPFMFPRTGELMEVVACFLNRTWVS